MKVDVKDLLMERMTLNYLALITMVILTISLSPPLFAQKLAYSSNPRSVLNTLHAGKLAVQVGAFRSEENARHMKAGWEKQLNYPVNIKHQGAFYLVIIEPMPRKLKSNPASRAPVTQPIYHSLPSIQYERKRLPSPASPIRHSLPRTYQQRERFFSPTFISEGSWYAGVDVGILKPNIGSTMLVNNESLFDQPNWIDRYSTQSSTHPLIAVEGGKFWRRNDKRLPGYALGLRYQHLFTRAISGRVTQYSEPRFNNYDYSWDIQSNIVSAYTKLQLIQWGRVTPYVSGGIGAAFNQSGQYTETADPGIDGRDTPDFRSGTQTNFAYDLGAGLDFVVNPKLLLSLGYDFQSLGEVSSHRAITTWSSQKLRLGNFYANTALLSLTYLFDNPKLTNHFEK